MGGHQAALQATRAESGSLGCGVLQRTQVGLDESMGGGPALKPEALGVPFQTG